MEDRNNHIEDRRSRYPAILSPFLSLKVGVLTGVLYVSILIALRIFG